MIEMQQGANSDTEPAMTAATTEPPKKMLLLPIDGLCEGRCSGGATRATHEIMRPVPPGTANGATAKQSVLHLHLLEGDL